MSTDWSPVGASILAGLALVLALLATCPPSSGQRLSRIHRARARPSRSGVAAAFIRKCAFRLNGHKRHRLYETALEQACYTMLGCLEAGQNLLQAIDVVARTGKPPLNNDFDLVLSEYEAGIGLHEALERLAGRINMQEVDHFVEAIHVCNTQGGSMRDLLATLGDLLREKKEWKREVSAKAGEARWSAVALASMPPVLAVYLFKLHPDLMKPMFNDPIGVAALLYSALSWAVGVILVWRLVYGTVNNR